MVHERTGDQLRTVIPDRPGVSAQWQGREPIRSGLDAGGLDAAVQHGSLVAERMHGR